MADTSLIFSGAPLTGLPVQLVFGDAGGTPAPVDVGVTLTAAITSLSGVVAVNYNSNTARPTVGEVSSSWQNADDVQTPMSMGWAEGVHFSAPKGSAYERAAGLQSPADLTWRDTLRIGKGRDVSRFQDASDVRAPASFTYDEAQRLRRAETSHFQEGLDIRLSRTTKFQDGLKDRRNRTAAPFERAVSQFVPTDSFYQRGLRYNEIFRPRYQQGMRPPPGIWVRPPPPDPDPCYIPNTSLVFSEALADGANLVFICERHTDVPPGPGETIVVPIRRVYIVLNTASLTRVSDGQVVPTFSMSMSLDVDSWTWSFSAAVPATAQSVVEPGVNGPVEVEALVNGVPYRFLIEQLSRDRAFGREQIRLAGRGKTALLDTPYSAGLNFTNPLTRTAQQIMGDVLTVNGVPMGWDVNWTPTDWTIPAGVFVHQGSYMSALTTIAGAVGGYIQPHNTLQEINVLLRYPTAPWEWDTVTPDYELPSAVVLREGIQWQEKPSYNRVYVGGTGVGVFGPVTRAGTDGTELAQQVLDPLITAIDAHRQRGIAVLSDTGRQAQVSLSLPVLAETGVIPPGKFVRYVDGGTTRIGITRSVSVEVGASAVGMRQQITLETHL